MMNPDSMKKLAENNMSFVVNKSLYTLCSNLSSRENPAYFPATGKCPISLERLGH